MTGNPAATAAIAAAVMTEAGDGVAPLPIVGGRRTASKSGLRGFTVGSLPSPASLPTHKFAAAAGRLDLVESAIDDANDMSDGGETSFQNNRMRRASEGQHLSGKKVNRADLRCQTCGKGYKHSSCLTKHLFVPIFLPVTQKTITVETSRLVVCAEHPREI
jgi:hypothetical protein